MTAPSPERAPMTDEQPSKEALDVWSVASDIVLAILRAQRDPSGPALADVVVPILDRFRAAGVREERKRLGNCPECGSNNFGYYEQDDEQNCDDCQYREATP